MTPFSLILPCYNEAANLPAIVARVTACARRRTLSPEQFQLFLVENGSTDQSRQVMDELLHAPGGEHLRIVPVPVNRGYGHGIISGLRAAPPGVLAYSHADQQCDPEDAFRGWELIRNSGPGVLVKGSRYGRAPGEWLFSRGFEATATVLLGSRLHEINAQPKVFASELLERIPHPPDDFAFDLYVVMRARAAGWTLREIDVKFPPRVHGQSNWSSTLRSRARTIGRQLAYMIELRRSGAGT